MGLSSSKYIERKKCQIKNEVIISSEDFHSLNQSITRASKSLCKIIVSSGRISSGFLIQFIKEQKNLYFFND